VIEQSGADLKRKDSLLILASTKGNIDILDGSSAINDPSRVYLPNFAKTIAQFFQAENAPLIVSNACISGLLAMIIAQRYLRAGTYKTIVVCGGDLVSEFTLSGFRSFNALSDKACRPFDKNRSGINLGEAAAAVVLTCEQTDIELINGASANDANHISGPARDGQGLLHAIQNVASSAELKSIDFISAHGTATEYNDEMEATAFSRCQLSEVPLHSLKGYYGHTLGAAGVLEAIMAVESLRKNTLIASLGFSEQGTTAAQRMITTTHTQPLTSFLKTASGFGGCNAAALFRKTK
jgi:3-oxoacyl-[acyl-carrier-protein] synthase-1